MLKMLTHAYTCLLCAAFLVYLVFLMLAQPCAQVSASSPEFCLSLPSISACSLSLPTAHDSWMPFHSLWCLEPMGANMYCEWERRFWEHASSGSHSDAKTNDMIFSLAERHLKIPMACSIMYNHVFKLFGLASLSLIIMIFHILYC